MNADEYKAARRAQGAEATKVNRKAKYAQMTVEQMLWLGAKQRAKEKGVPFNLSVTDIEIPEVCPLLGVPLKSRKGQGKHGHGPDSPSLDRLKPELGYVPLNVWVISAKANVMKSNASLEELQALVVNLAHELSRRGL